MNHDGFARYSDKSWPAGNMGGNAGVALVPKGMESFFVLVALAPAENLGGTADYSAPSKGRFLFFCGYFTSKS